MASRNKKGITDNDIKKITNSRKSFGDPNKMHFRQFFLAMPNISKNVFKIMCYFWFLTILIVIITNIYIGIDKIGYISILTIMLTTYSLFVTFFVWMLSIFVGIFFIRESKNNFIKVKFNELLLGDRISSFIILSIYVCIFLGGIALFFILINFFK